MNDANDKPKKAFRSVDSLTEHEKSLLESRKPKRFEIDTDDEGLRQVKKHFDATRKRIREEERKRLNKPKPPDDDDPNDLA